MIVFRPDNRRSCCKDQRNLIRMPTGVKTYILYICRVCQAQHTKMLLDAAKMRVRD